MNKLTVFGLSAGAALGAAVIGYIAFVGYVEDQARAFLTDTTEAPQGTVVSIGEVVADPLSGRLTLTDYKASIPPITLNDVEPTRRVAVDMTIATAVADLETRFFLTPIESVKALSSTKISIRIDTDVLAAESDQPTAASTTTITAAALTAENMGPVTDPMDLYSDDPIVLARNLEIMRSTYSERFRIEDVEISNDELPAPLRIAALQIDDIADGLIGRFEIQGLSGDLTTTMDIGALDAQDNATTAGGKIFIETMGLENFQAIRFQELGHMFQLDPAAEPTPGELFSTLDGTVLYGTGIDVTASDGSRTVIGSFRVGDMALEDGIPVRFGMRADAIRQTLPPELVEQAQAALPIPVALTIPETIDSRMKLDYAMDTATDTSTVTLTGYDTFTDVDMDFRLSLLDLLAEGDGTVEPFQLTKIAGLSLGLTSTKRWDPPVMVGDKPSPRLFATSFLVGTPMPPPIGEAIVPAVLSFLNEGGMLVLTAAPGEPLAFQDLQVLQIMGPAAALQILGLTVKHDPLNQPVN